MATFAKDNVTKFTQKSVLELGSGTGIVGIALAKHLFEKEATELGDPYLLTDGFEKVVETLSNNCRNNEVEIKCELLRWNEGEDIQKLQRRCLVVERRRESPHAAREDLEQELEKPLFCSENLCEKETPLQ